MKDVSSRPDTHREATAESFVAMPHEALQLLRERRVEKGDALEVSRAAGILAAKRTSDLIPYCHDVLLASVEVNFAFETDGVRIETRVRSIAANGIDMEALTGASVAALTLCDMIRPHAANLEIRSTRLTEKSGGRRAYQDRLDPPARVAVISLCGARENDKVGRAVLAELEADASTTVSEYVVVSEDGETLRARVRRLVEDRTNVILTVGGTGLSPDDHLVDALRPLITRELPGIMEAARSYGQRRTPYSMLSRGVAGMIGDTLLMTFPGSSRGARETYAALFPAILHIVHVQRRASK